MSSGARERAISALRDRIDRCEKKLKPLYWRERELLGEHRELRIDIGHLEDALQKLRRRLRALQSAPDE